jgi:hypothetical protein
VRFAGAGAVHRVAGTLLVGDGRHPGAVTVALEPAGVACEALRRQGDEVDFAFTTAPEAPVGFDLRIDPPAAPITWKLFLDDAPWPEGHTFAGPFGLPALAALEGVTSDEARRELYAPAMPVVDPAHDLGAFFTRDGSVRGGPSPGPAPAGEAATREMQRMLEQWGYASPPANKK